MDTYTSPQIEALDALKANGFYQTGSDIANGLRVFLAKNLTRHDVAQVTVDSEGLCNRTTFAQYLNSFKPQIRVNAHQSKASLFSC